jgi:hypothetical protein
MVHLVVADGPGPATDARRVLDGAPTATTPVELLALSRRAGDQETFGHRLYAAASYLLGDTVDMVCLLDADNTYEPTHVADLVAALEGGDATWAYSLRNIISPAGGFLCRDNCDSLGPWERGIVADVGRGLLSPDEDAFFRTHRWHVDTNCYALRTEVLRTYAPHLVSGPRGDSAMATHLVAEEPSAGTGRYTVNYRIGSAVSGTEDYFRNGNRRMAERYPEGLPWSRT